MNDACKFMLEEYKQMVKIYTDLLEQNNKMLTFYATIIGIGGSAITVLFKLGEEGLDISQFPLSTGIGLLAVLLSLVGSIIFFSLLGLRMEMILYIRTINAVRGYFVEKNKKESKNKTEKDEEEPNNKPLQIKEFLVLPSYDKDTPPFRDSWVSWFFWTILLIAFINSAILAAGFYLLVPIQGKMRLIIALHLLGLCLGIHFLIYHTITSHMEKIYVSKRPISEERGTIIT